MNKSFIIENTVKTGLTAIVLLVCWATLTPTFAADADDNRRAMFEHRMHDRMEERLSEIDKHLSVDQVRDIVEGRIASMGNTNLKVGKTTATENNSVLVDIVTKDDSLVQTVEISTRTGRPAEMDRRVAKRMMRGKMGGHEGGREFGRERRGGRGFNALAMAMGPNNRDLELTVEQARTLAESRLILSGNDRLKVGSVEAVDDDTIVVEIVTLEDSLVVRREIDRSSGRTRRGFAE
jgi:hypothetical protein